MEKISDDIYMHAEMGVRIMEMINRDEQLKREVEANYDQGQNFKDDFDFVKNVKAMAEIHIKANNAEKFIAREVAKNPSGRYDAKTKEALVTDILVQQLVEVELSLGNDVLQNDGLLKRVNPSLKAYRQLVVSCEQSLRRLGISTLLLDLLRCVNNFQACPAFKVDYPTGNSLYTPIARSSSEWL
jgi:hypothetical protein